MGNRALHTGYMTYSFRAYNTKQECADKAYDDADHYMTLGYKVKLIAYNNGYILLFNNRTIEPRIEVA